jgi:hypothetical protein
MGKYAYRQNWGIDRFSNFAARIFYSIEILMTKKLKTACDIGER